MTLNYGCGWFSKKCSFYRLPYGRAPTPLLINRSLEILTLFLVASVVKVYYLSSIIYLNLKKLQKIIFQWFQFFKPIVSNNFSFLSKLLSNNFWKIKSSMLLEKSTFHWKSLWSRDSPPWKLYLRTLYGEKNFFSRFWSSWLF